MSKVYTQTITNLDTIQVTAGYPDYPGGGTHGGMDTVTVNGQVYAPKSGTVITAHHWQGGTNPSTVDAWGNYILVAFDDNKYWLAAHFRSQDWNEGDLISKGEFIGSQGTTGNVTGPHTHWEYWSGGMSTAYRSNPAIVTGIPSEVGIYNVKWGGVNPPSPGGPIPWWILKAVKNKRRRKNGS